MPEYCFVIKGDGSMQKLYLVIFKFLNGSAFQATGFYMLLYTIKVIMHATLFHVMNKITKYIVNNF